jgi:hypothetical protein
MADKQDAKVNSLYLFDTTDSTGRRVKLESKQYTDHIILRHPEMEGNVEAMKETVENPQLIIESKQNPKRWLYVGKSELATYPVVTIKTVVDHSSSESGYVVTGLFQKKVNVEKEGTVIYEKED